MFRQAAVDKTRFKLGALSGQEQDRPMVLFVCVHNAGRSRMAEAFFNQLAGERYRGLSAGTDPARKPHPEVVDAMREVDIDLDNTPGTLLTPELAESAVRVIGMGCAVEEACPALTVPLEDWDLPDPKGKSREEVAEIRDRVELKVRNLVGQLDRDLATDRR
ncbi:MAG: arsenate reductase ArsC [Actinomycetota bacterium]|nr:arsenate reductase ArsC [Actinomycetota bacterium]